MTWVSLDDQFILQKKKKKKTPQKIPQIPWLKKWNNEKHLSLIKYLKILSRWRKSQSINQSPLTTSIKLNRKDLEGCIFLTQTVTAWKSGIFWSRVHRRYLYTIYLREHVSINVEMQHIYDEMNKLNELPIKTVCWMST